MIEDQRPYGSASGDGAAETTLEVAPRDTGAARELERNRLLGALPAVELDRLLGVLRPVRLDLRQVLIEPDEPIRHVYFIRSGVGSVLAIKQTGGDIEVGTVGNEGFIGLPVLFGAESMPFRVIVQVEGDGWRLDSDVFRRIVEERAPVRQLLLRYAHYYGEQVAQSVACNQLHTLEERGARWLLMTHDRVVGDEFDLTHEFLSYMLGVRRAGVTVAMGVLQRAGIVRYSRGHVTVLDRERLEEASCDCYRITRVGQERLFATIWGTAGGVEAG